MITFFIRDAKNLRDLDLNCLIKREIEASDIPAISTSAFSQELEFHFIYLHNTYG